LWRSSWCCRLVKERESSRREARPASRSRNKHASKCKSFHTTKKRHNFFEWALKTFETNGLFLGSSLPPEGRRWSGDRCRTRHTADHI
jgi:hypothetical protein